LNHGSYPGTRLRRMRSSDFSRRLMRETEVSVNDLIYPVFVIEGSGESHPVPSMPGVSRVTIDLLLRDAESLRVWLNVQYVQSKKNFQNLV